MGSEEIEAEYEEGEYRSLGAAIVSYAMREGKMKKTEKGARGKARRAEGEAGEYGDAMIVKKNGAENLRKGRRTQRLERLAKRISRRGSKRRWRFDDPTLLGLLVETVDVSCDAVE
jgi:hypothetical protein